MTSPLEVEPPRGALFSTGPDPWASGLPVVARKRCPQMTTSDARVEYGTEFPPELHGRYVQAEVTERQPKQGQLDAVLDGLRSRVLVSDGP